MPWSGMVESFSFTSLAEKILSTEGGAAVQTLSDAGRAVLVRRALEELMIQGMVTTAELCHLILYQRLCKGAVPHGILGRNLET